VRKFSKEENMDSRVKVPHRPMTIELAQRAAMAAGEKTKQFGKEISIAVVDESGHLVYFARGNSCGFISFETAKGKASMAAGFRRPTRWWRPVERTQLSGWGRPQN
jgi:glc operon protein GlcG